MSKMTNNNVNAGTGSTTTTIGLSSANGRHSLPVPESTLNPQRLSAMSAQELHAKQHANRPNSEILGAHYKSPEAEGGSFS